MCANRIIIYNICLSEWILVNTGVAKILSAFGSAKILAIPDPVIGVPFWQLMLTVGVLELIVVFCCILSKSHLADAVLIAWISTDFLAYRFGLWWVGWRKPCSCMGNLTDALNITPQTADFCSKLLLTYLLIGSYATLFWFWNNKRKSLASVPI